MTRPKKGDLERALGKTPCPVAWDALADYYEEMGRSRACAAWRRRADFLRVASGLVADKMLDKAAVSKRQALMRPNAHVPVALFGPHLGRHSYRYQMTARRTPSTIKIVLADRRQHPHHVPLPFAPREVASIEYDPAKRLDADYAARRFREMADVMLRHELADGAPAIGAYSTGGVADWLELVGLTLVQTPAARPTLSVVMAVDLHRPDVPVPILVEPGTLEFCWPNGFVFRANDPAYFLSALCRRLDATLPLE